MRENTREKLSRVIRNTTRIRQMISRDELEKAITLFLPNDLSTKATILGFAAQLPKAAATSVSSDDDVRTGGSMTTLQP